MLRSFSVQLNENCRKVPIELLPRFGNYGETEEIYFVVTRAERAGEKKGMREKEMSQGARDTHTHTCRLGNAALVIFHLERKHLPLHSTYGGSPYAAGNSNSRLSISD